MSLRTQVVTPPWCIVVTENGYYSYTIVAKSEEELVRFWREDKERFRKWKKTWGPKIEIKKTYHFFGNTPSATETL